jgi:hypothetical protein
MIFKILKKKVVRPKEQVAPAEKEKEAGNNKLKVLRWDSFDRRVYNLKNYEYSKV